LSLNWAECSDSSMVSFTEATAIAFGQNNTGPSFSSAGSAALSTNVWRAASPANRFPNNFLAPSAAYSLNFAGRYAHYIGSGDRKALSVLLNNLIIDTTNITKTGNTLTITDLYLESATLGVSVRIKFNGGKTSVTLLDGQYDFVADPVLPSDFSLNEFTLGDKYYLRVKGSIPIGGRLPIMRFVDSSESSGNYFDSASGSCANISGTGPLTWTGTKTFTFGFSPILIGKFVSGDPRTWLGAGDSIFDGAGDTLGSAQSVGTAYFARALFTPTPATRAIGGINLGESSGKVDAWVGSGANLRPELMAMVKYCSGAVCEYGTNAFDNGANLNSSQMNYTYGLETALWANLKLQALAPQGASPFKIVRTLLGVRTNAPTGNAPADQVIYGPKWDVGGNVDDYNSRIQAEVGTNIDAVFDPSLIVRYDPTDVNSTNYHKWKNGVASALDGTHPVGLVHIQLGAALRTVIDSVI
jgi:hypothetical protein